MNEREKAIDRQQFEDWKHNPETRLFRAKIRASLLILEALEDYSAKRWDLSPRRSPLRDIDGMDMF